MKIRGHHQDHHQQVQSQDHHQAVRTPSGPRHGWRSGKIGATTGRRRATGPPIEAEAVIRSTSQPARPGRPPASHHHQDIEAEAATRTRPDKGNVILTLSAELSSADISHNWLISKGPLSLRLVWSPIQSPTSFPKAPAGPPGRHDDSHIGQAGRLLQFPERS